MLKSYPAKVLLLGEYTILTGSKALALPFNSLKGQWSFEKKNTPIREISQKNLREFASTDHASIINTHQLKNDLDQGLWFDSTIPQGFGLGSSGAVVAALFDRYGNPRDELHHDKEDLARLESFFHGSSSGLDPLVSHIQKPLLIHDPLNVEVLEVSPKLSGFFLINTGRPRQSAPLVSVYQEKMKDPEFKRGCAESLAKDVNFALDALFAGDGAKVFHHLWHISKFQWEFFPEMIPTKERSLWTRGLESGDYICKLCGAGGGGFILGLSQKYSVSEMRSILPNYELRDLS